jgi:hypothetical protein
MSDVCVCVCVCVYERQREMWGQENYPLNGFFSALLSSDPRPKARCLEMLQHFEKKISSYS